MAKIDRLTTLIEKFELSAETTSVEEANLFVLKNDDDRPCEIIFNARNSGLCTKNKNVMLSIFVDWGGNTNPVVSALPECISLPVTKGSDLSGVVTLIESELSENRCGAASVLGNLAQILMVRILRQQIEKGTATTGLLAGLADPRLSRAIVAMHESPSRQWSNADLATEAGMSLSRFSEVFSQTLGQTPKAYLRRWRLTLARKDLAKGLRIASVSRRCGYGSPEAFNRAFRSEFDMSPMTVRKMAAIA